MKFKSLVASKLYELHKLTDISMTIVEKGRSSTTQINCNFGDSDTIKMVCEKFRSYGHLIKVNSLEGVVVQGFSYTYNELGI